MVIGVWTFAGCCPEDCVLRRTERADFIPIGIGCPRSQYSLRHTYFLCVRVDAHAWLHSYLGDFVGLCAIVRGHPSYVFRARATRWEGPWFDLDKEFQESTRILWQIDPLLLFLLRFFILFLFAFLLHFRTLFLAIRMFGWVRTTRLGL